MLAGEQGRGLAQESRASRKVGGPAREGLVNIKKFLGKMIRYDLYLVLAQVQDNSIKSCFCNSK